MRLLLGGDVMTGRGIDQAMAHPGDPTLHESWVKSAVEYLRLAERKNGPIPRPMPADYVWGDALPLLNGADIRIINLETAVTNRGEPWPGKGIHYRMHPKNLDVVSAAGIDCCVLANNHVLDWSYPGLAQTLDSLHAAGLATAGAGANLEAARTPATIEFGPVRVIVVALGLPSSGIDPSWAAGPDRPGLAYASSPSGEAVTEIAQELARVADPGDVVVVSIHWGPNWGYRIPASHRRFAHDLIDRAGVDLIHGHSSHHPLGIEVYEERLILYGCGDLINDYEGISGHEEFHPDISVLYLATLDGDGAVQSVEIVPLEMRRFRLERASDHETEWLGETLGREDEPLGTRVEKNGNRLLVRW